MIDRCKTPSSWLLERLCPDTAVYGFLQPVMIVGLKAIEALACMESLTLSSVQTSARLARCCLSLKAFSSYCSHLKEESDETHQKIARFIRRYFQESSLYWPSPSLEYERFIQRIVTLSDEKCSPQLIKQAFKEFFHSCDESQAFELIRFGDLSQFHLEDLITRFSIPDDVELKEHFLQECVNFSYRSLNFLRGFLFFIYHFEERLILDNPIGISLRDFYHPYLDVATRSRYWMDDLLRLYPKTIQMTFREQFIGFAKEAVRNQPLALIRSTKEPSGFFSYHDLARWLLDASFHERDVAALFGGYLLNPKLLTPVFRQLGPLGANETALMEKRLRWVQMINTQESALLQKKSVLGSFVEEKAFDKIWDFIEQYIVLASLQTQTDPVCFLDVCHHLLKQKVFIDPTTFKVRLEIKGAGQFPICVYEYLLLMRGKEFFTKFQDFFHEYGLDNRLLSQYFIALMQSATYAFDLRSFGLKKLPDFAFSKKNRLHETPWCQLTHHPLLLIGAGKKPELAQAFLEQLILHSEPQDSDAIAYFDPYYFDSMTILTSLFNPFATFAFAERNLVDGASLDIFSFKQLQQLEAFKKGIIKKCAANPDRFMTSWIDFVKRAILIASRHGINHLPSCHVTNEICNIPYILRALQEEEIFPRLQTETRACLAQFLAKEERNVHEAKVFPFLQAILDFDLSPFTEKFHLSHLQTEFFNFLFEFETMAAGPLKMVQDYYMQKKWENTLAFYFPSMPFEMVMFLYHMKKQVHLMLLSGSIEIEEIEKIVRDHEVMIDWCKEEIDDDQLPVNLGFIGISHFVMQYYITQEKVAFAGLRAFFDLPSLFTLSDIDMIHRSGLNDCYHFIKRVKSIDGLKNKSYLLPANLSEELPHDLAAALDKKGRIAQKIDQVYLPFKRKLESLEPIQTPVGDYLGMFQEIANLGAFAAPLLEPFKHFAEVVAPIPPVELKGRFRTAYLTLQGAHPHMPDAMKERIRVLFEEIKQALEGIDPIRIRELLTVFEGIDFIALEDGTEGRIAPYVVASSVLDDSGAPFTQVQLIGHMRQLVTKVLRRDHHLAVPEDRKEKKAFYDKMEIMLYRLKKEVALQMTSLEKLDLIGPMLTNVAIAGSHCATRWTMEIEGAIEALSVESAIEDFESLIKKILYQSRKLIVMNFLELAFQPEVSAFGIEALIHPFNYVRAQYAADLGLPPLNEGLVLEEQAEDIEQRLEEFSFFKQVEQALIKQLFKIVYFFRPEAREKRIFEQALIAYVIENLEEGREIPGVDLEMIDEDDVITSIRPKFLLTLTSLASMRPEDLKSQSQAELGLMDAMIDYFHKPEGKAALQDKDILIKEELSAITTIFSSKVFPEPIKTQLEAGSELIISSALEEALVAFIGEEIEESKRRAFVDGILSEPKWRHEFLSWISNPTAANLMTFEKSYYAINIARILSTIYRKMKTTGILPVFPYDPFRSFFPAWGSEKSLLNFFIANFLVLGSGIEAERIGFFALRESSASLALTFHEAGLDEVPTAAVKGLIEKGLPLALASQKSAILREFVQGSIRRAYEQNLTELFSSRPTTLANVLFFKLVDEEYVKLPD